MAKLYNRAKMTTVTIGTGTMTLGSADTACLSFSDAGVQDGDQVSYVIEDGSDFELGIGTYTSAGTTLSRDAVFKSSAGGAKLSLSGNAKVFITALAEDIVSKALMNVYANSSFR